MSKSLLKHSLPSYDREASRPSFRAASYSPVFYICPQLPLRQISTSHSSARIARKPAYAKQYCSSPIPSRMHNAPQNYSSNAYAHAGMLETRRFPWSALRQHENSCTGSQAVYPRRFLLARDSIVDIFCTCCCARSQSPSSIASRTPGKTASS